MKVVVYKANMGAILISANIMLLIVLAISIGNHDDMPYWIIAGIIGWIATIVVTIHYFTTPSAMVMLSDDENTLILPKGVEMPVSDLLDVSYKEDRGRGDIKIPWSTGRIQLLTRRGVYKFSYVHDCAAAADKLKHIIYKERVKEGIIKSDTL